MKETQLARNANHVFLPGPAGVLLNLLDRHPMRPAHIHLMVSAPEYRTVTTQIYPKEDPYVKTDTVFAVKPDLLVDFKPSDKDPKATLDLEYNVVLAPKSPAGSVSFLTFENQLPTNIVSNWRL